MAEQDKEQKPKATLIKHKKEEGAPAPEQHADDLQKKRIKVVVKHKAHGSDGKPTAETTQTERSSTTGASSGSAPRPAPSASSSSSSSEANRDYSTKQGIVGGRYVGPRRQEEPRPPRPEATERPQGDRPAFTDRPQGDRPAQGDRPQGDRPAYTSRPSYGDRPQGDRPQGDRPSYGDRPQGQGYQGGYNRPPQGDRPQGDRPSYGDRPQGQGYQGGYNRPPQGDRPQGDRPSYGDRPQGQGYQGGYNRPPQGQGGQSSGGYQGGYNRPPQGQGGQSSGGYQGGYNRPPQGQGGTGYQGTRPAGTGYQGNRPAGAGGYQGGRPAGGGYQGGRPGGPGRPGGGYQGGRPGPGNGSPPPPAEPQGPKKFFKAKKKENFVRKDRHLEKELFLKNKKGLIKINPVPKEIDILEVITVAELARKMNLKASDLISKLFGMGMMVSINQQIDAETATILAQEYGCDVKIVSLFEETLIESAADNEEDLAHRPPIVTVMGHVDHGKTKTLDAIRSANVVAGESGGITQHIGAYQVETEHGKITFFDTPGHEAFTMMRARGAQATDIVVLVVAANDGVMPQTIEAIRHAQEAKVPIIVAVNKVDLPEANIDRVKQQLSEYELMADDWGGNTSYYNISALKKEGIPELLEGILLQAEILDLKANYGRRAEGKIIESKIDQGRGIVATVIVQKGTLKVGDSFVAGVFPGKVRAMFNDKGEKLTEAPPSTPVEVLGFSGVPEAGDPFQVTENEKYAREIGEKRQELKRMEAAKNVKKITLDNLFDSITDGGVQELKVIVKGDVHGSVEAIQQSLEKLSTKEIRLKVILAAAGTINEGDVRLASASQAIIVGFHVRPSAQAQLLADQEKVEIRKYSIIYDVIEDMKSAMEGMLTPDLKEEEIGKVEVRETFKVPKIGTIGGSYVLEGVVRRSASVHVIREGVEVFTGKIASLRRFKDDAREVAQGFECGVGVEGFPDMQVGDILEVFEMKEIAKKLSAPLSSLTAEDKK